MATTPLRPPTGQRRDFQGMERTRLRAARMFEHGTSQAEVHSLMNNCYSDHAVVNARQLDALLRGEDPDSAAQQLRMQARQAEGQPGTPACNLNLRASP
jgi:hypothetical protein